MKDEIKEILGNINYEVEIDKEWVEPLGLDRDGWKLLLDYITNLQEENKQFKARWKDTNVIIKDDKTLVMNTDAYDCLEDYKSRIDKVIEWIRMVQGEEKYLEPIINTDELDDLLNILQGDK